MKILLVRNDYDMMTHYMFEWSHPLKVAAEKEGHTVNCVDGPSVTRSEMMSRLRKVDHKFIILNGHGTKSAFFGYGNEELICHKDAALFRDKIVFARACDCVRVLGKEAVANKCKAFIGYKYEFVNVRLTETDLRPREDLVSRPIWEVSNTVPHNLIKGKTVSSSLRAAQRRATNEMEKLLASNEPGSTEVLRALIINDEGLAYHGNGSVSISG